MSNPDHSPLHSLKEGHWFKLICGASFQDLSTIRNLSLIYTIAGVDCIDVAADPAAIAAAQEGIRVATQLNEEAATKGFFRMGHSETRQTHGCPSPERSVSDRVPQPWLMVSFNDGEDPHFRKAEFDVDRCPTDCPRPCEAVCPAQAITFNPSFRGVIEARCYGCGRCLPVCPSQLVVARSYVSTPGSIVPLLQEMKIEAIEIHTQIGHEEDFQRLWQVIQPWSDRLEVLAISCQDHPHLLEYLHFLHKTVNPLPCPLIWQTDGRPMSGDIGRGTTHLAIKMARKVLGDGLPGFVQLAGGTNAHTVTKLRELNLLQQRRIGEKGNEKGKVSGIAYGSYARSLILPILEQLETIDRSNLWLENYPELLWKAVRSAYSLVSQLKIGVRD